MTAAPLALLANALGHVSPDEQSLVTLTLVGGASLVVALVAGGRIYGGLGCGLGLLGWALGVSLTLAFWMHVYFWFYNWPVMQPFVHTPFGAWLSGARR